MVKKRIAVTGIALNQKSGAVVQTDKTNYWADGLSEWSEKYDGKKVKVTATLEVK